MNPPRRPRARSVLRAGIAALSATVAISASPATAVADSTHDYPIPHRMIVTTCTPEQILAAARDFTPIYYERYMIDKHNKSPQVQQAAIDSAHYFYSLNPADRRTYSEHMVTNFADPMTAAWPNWAEIFFNNNGPVDDRHSGRPSAGGPDDQQGSAGVTRVGSAVVIGGQLLMLAR